MRLKDSESLTRAFPLRLKSATAELKEIVEQLIDTGGVSMAL